MAKKHKHPEHVNHERWLVSYADFITLLFAFFVVMFSVSQVDTAKIGKFSESFAEAFGVHVLHGSAGVFDGTSTPFSWTAKSAKKTVQTNLPPQLAQVEGQMQQIQAALAAARGRGQSLGQGQSDAKLDLSLGKGPGDQETADPSKPDKASKVAIKPPPNQPDPPEPALGFRILRRRNELVLRLDIDVLFSSGSDEIDEQAGPLLEALGAELKDKPVVVRVEGHTDNRPIHTTEFRSNWHLSSARATAVLVVFMEKTGIVPTRLAATAFGEYQPIASNDTEEGRAKNRRVDIVVGLEPAQEPATTESGFAPGTEGATPGTDAAQGSAQPL